MGAFHEQLQHLKEADVVVTCADYDAEWAQELEVLESILTPEELESRPFCCSSNISELQF